MTWDRDQWNADLLRRDEALRPQVERWRDIDRAIEQAKQKNPQPLLDLIEPADLRQAIEDAGILPERQKRGPKITPIGIAVKRVRRILAIRHRRMYPFRQRLPQGTWSEVINDVVLKMIFNGEFGPCPSREEIAASDEITRQINARLKVISERVMAKLHR